MIPAYNFKNNYQKNFAAHFLFFPVCENSVLVYPTGFNFIQ